MMMRMDFTGLFVQVTAKQSTGNDAIAASVVCGPPSAGASTPADANAVLAKATKKQRIIQMISREVMK